MTAFALDTQTISNVPCLPWGFTISAPDLGPPTSRWQESVPARSDRVARAGLPRRRAQPATLFSPSAGRRRSSFPAQRSHGKASLRALGTHRLPSSRGRGRPGPPGPLGGWPDGRGGGAACGAGRGALESEGAQPPRRGGIGAAGGKARVSVAATQSELQRSGFLPSPEPRVAPDGRRWAGEGGRRLRPAESRSLRHCLGHGLTRLSVAAEHLSTAVGALLRRGQPRTGH